MHEANATVRVGRHHRRAGGAALPVRPAQGPDVVDDVGPQVQRGLHHCGLVGVDRDRHTQGHRMANDGQHAGQFFILGNRWGPRPGGFAPNVQQMGTVLEQTLAMEQGCMVRGVLATV